MNKRKLQLVPKPVVVSGLSHEEEARALQLADIALHNPIEGLEIIQSAGCGARRDHRRLKEEVQKETEKILNSKRAG